MQANDLLNYREKIIEAFRDGTFYLNIWKKTDDAAYDYVLKDVKNVIQEIKFIEEKINLSLLKDVFGLSSPANYAKMAINTSPDENKNCSRDKRQNIRFKRQNKNMSETEQKCWWDIKYYSKNSWLQ